MTIKVRPSDIPGHGLLYLDDRNIATLRYADGTVICHRDEVEHKLRIFDGWGMAKEALDWLISNDFIHAKFIVKRRDGTMCVLTARIAEWFSKGTDFQSENFEPQRILPESRFTSE